MPLGRLGCFAALSLVCRQFSAETGAMFSLLGREARRLPGMGASVHRTVERYQMFGYSRLFGTSDLCVFDDSSRRTWSEGVEVDKGMAQKLAAAGQMWRWTSPTGTWKGSALPIKVCEAVQGGCSATLGGVASVCGNGGSAGGVQRAAPPRALKRYRCRYKQRVRCRSLYFGLLATGCVCYPLPKTVLLTSAALLEVRDMDVSHNEL